MLWEKDPGCHSPISHEACAHFSSRCWSYWTRVILNVKQGFSKTGNAADKVLLDETAQSRSVFSSSIMSLLYIVFSMTAASRSTGERWIPKLKSNEIPESREGLLIVNICYNMERNEHRQSDCKEGFSSLQRELNWPDGEPRNKLSKQTWTFLQSSHSPALLHAVWAGHSLSLQENSHSRSLIGLDWNRLPLCCPHI